MASALTPMKDAMWLQRCTALSRNVEFEAGLVAPDLQWLKRLSNISKIWKEGEIQFLPYRNNVLPPDIPFLHAV
jgi:hypothetical protein